MGLKSSRLTENPSRARFAVVFILLLVTLAFLFRNNFFPGYTLFSNDGPLGQLMAECHWLPEAFSGGWEDLNSIGTRGGGAFPSITYGLLWILGPIGFSKFYAASTLLILGLSAWCFFRQLGLAPVACVLGGLAAALNSSFFSAACWGVGTHPLTVAMSFLALAALADTTSPKRWLRVILAGLAVGMGLMEGADIGAIFSVYVAAFAMYQAWVSEGPRPANLVKGVLRVGVVAGFAAFLAFHAISVLVTTQIKGVAGTQQDRQTKEQHWDFATQWSLPKHETLAFLVPGLFGYRMDTKEGGAYWGAVGRDPNWYRYFESGKQGPPPQGPMRFSGGSPYAGVLVLLVAAWTIAQSLRKNQSQFSLSTRRWVWFWSGVVVVSLLLSFGRFAPFYQFLYALPYFSTIRNPAKFTYPCNLAVITLFAHGVSGLYQLYIAPQNVKGAPVRESLGAWWRRAGGFDRRWTIASGIFLGIAALAWLIFSSSSDAFQKYLQEVQFDAPTAESIARFSVTQVGVFLIFLGGAIFLLTLILSGAFSGSRARWAGLLLGGLMLVDLSRADQPWIVTWDYAQKYATNPIIDLLREKPYEHRVAALPRWLSQVFRLPNQLVEAEQYFRQLYGIEWAQHHFVYYNVQSLDVIQMPRVAEDLAAYEGKFFPTSAAELFRVTRHWQLTNTRYLLGCADFLDFLNQQFDPIHRQFRIAQRFEIVPKPGITHPTKLEELTALLNTNGPYALFEFGGALPRAKLYSNWQVPNNDQAGLDLLASSAFDPENSVLLSESKAPPPGAATNESPPEVKFQSYTPNDIVLNAAPTVPSILLLNDRFDPNWQVFVDGKPETLLRCNYIMRGVHLAPGVHKVEFLFKQPMSTFYVTLSAILLGLLLCGTLFVWPSKPSQRSDPVQPKTVAKVPASARP